MEFEQMKLDEFALWLRSLPEATRFDDDLRSDCCPIAKYTGQSAAAWISGMPNWASRFIERFDELADASHKGALEALDAIESMNKSK